MSHSSLIPNFSAGDEPSFFVSHDQEFTAVLGAAPRLVSVVAADAHEGPVYVAGEDALYFTTLPPPGAGDAPQVAIKRLALDGERFPLEAERVSVVRSSANAANGMALGLDGRLVVCEQGSRSRQAAITEVEPATGEVQTLVDSWEGRRLNSPNDVVVKSDGSVWFTDPSYGFLQGFKPDPQAGDHVYRYDRASGRLSVVDDTFDKPNGLAFSPDERVLYITDSGANQEAGSFHPGRPHHIRAFDVHEGRHLHNGRLLAVTAPGFPDGIKADSEGRVYASSFRGVQVFSSAGHQLGEILLPGAVNFAWGGPNRNILFVTADSAIWAVVLHATGPAPTSSKRERRLKGA